MTQTMPIAVMELFSFISALSTPNVMMMGFAEQNDKWYVVEAGARGLSAANAQ